MPEPYQEDKVREFISDSQNLLQIIGINTENRILILTILYNLTCFCDLQSTRGWADRSKMSIVLRKTGLVWPAL